MKILHIITGLDTGGAEMALCRLLESLRPPDFEHTVVALGAEGTMSTRVARSAPVQHLGMKRGHMSLVALLRLRRMLHSWRPDVIHSWMYHADLAAILAAIGTGAPVLWGIRQSLYRLQREKIGTRMVIQACRALSGVPTQIIYNSSTSAAQHEAFGFRESRRLVVANGFDMDLFHADVDARTRVRASLSIASDDLVIGLVARWHPMKNHANFLRAAALMTRSRLTAVYVLVGEGIDHDNVDLMALVDSLNLHDRVRICGRRDDMPAVNAALDVASSSSWGEAFPNAIGEAMACEVPCVATDVGDVREIIGDTGIVVPADDPQALCRGWEKLAGLTDTDRRALGRRARKRIKGCYSLASMAGRYASIYAEVMGSR